MPDAERIGLRTEELGRRLPILFTILTVIGLLLAAVAAAQIVARLVDGSADPVLIGLAAVELLCGLAMAAVALVSLRALRTSRVLLTPQGLTNRQLRDRLIPWSSITAIETLPRGAYLRVRVELDDGRRVMLAAPHARATAPHPHFTADRDTITAWWRRHAVSDTTRT